jgi:hypothetical protein
MSTPEVASIMVDLADQGETPALEAFDHPDLPQRSLTVEVLGHDAGRQPLELAVRAGLRQARVTHVVVELEFRIVHPDRRALERNPAELLAIARNSIKNGTDEPLDLFEVDSAVLVLEGAQIVDLRGCDVHVEAGPLEQEEGGVLGGQALEVEPCHRESSAGLAPADEGSRGSTASFSGSDAVRQASSRPQPARVQAPTAAS